MGPLLLGVAAALFEVTALFLEVVALFGVVIAATALLEGTPLLGLTPLLFGVLFGMALLSLCLLVRALNAAVVLWLEGRGGLLVLLLLLSAGC